MQHWVKAIYNDPGRTRAAEWKSLSWVSDGPPSRAPRYTVGDELLLYDVPRRSFPARARVINEPRSRPGFVDRYGGPGEGRRWPYVTDVEVLGAVDRSVAPTRLMVDVPITQGGHWRIESQVYAAVATLLPDGFQPPRLTAPLARPVPIEQSTDEPFEQRFELSTRIVYRREQRLVERFARQLREKGHRVTRHAITLPDGTELRSDLFDHKTRLLVEAKAVADRASLRMAVGQLLDYERFVDPKPEFRAVLVPERPAPDLIELLDTHQIASIWLSGQRFRDNRNGKVV